MCNPDALEEVLRGVGGPEGGSIGKDGEDYGMKDLPPGRVVNSSDRVTKDVK